MTSIRAKTFVQAIREFYVNKRKFKSFFDDHRLTQLEKTILDCLILIYDNKSAEVIDTLMDLTPSGDPIIDAERELLLALAFNNKCESTKAIPYFKRSIELMKHSPLKHRLLTAQCNLFYTYLNLKNRDGMTDVISQLKPDPSFTQLDLINLYSCKLIYANYTNNFEDSEKLIAELKSLGADMSENHKTGFYLDCFDFYFKTDQYDKCYEVLKEMTRLKKLHLGINYKFMKGVLDNITANKPLYLYDQDFEEYPSMHYQMKVLKALEQKQIDEAHSYWDKLREMAPLVYLPGFQYTADKCLFSVCLKMHLPKEHVPAARRMATIDSSNKVQLVIELLSESSDPINKEELYELVYGEPAQYKDDFKKLAQLIYKTRQTQNVEIKTRKGCYYLDKKIA